MQETFKLKKKKKKVTATTKNEKRRKHNLKHRQLKIEEYKPKSCFFANYRI